VYRAPFAEHPVSQLSVLRPREIAPHEADTSSVAVRRENKKQIMYFSKAVKRREYDTKEIEPASQFVDGCMQSLASFGGVAVSTAADTPFDPFADPFAPFAPAVVNVAKEGILTGNIGEARWPLPEPAADLQLKVIGHNDSQPGDTIARGRNGFVAIAKAVPTWAAPTSATPGSARMSVKRSAT
jgi:hypothetical protein